MGNIRIPLQADKIYHLFNHAVGHDNLFVNQGNYHYFLQKYAEHLHAIFETYCYCLLPNHFHFLVRVRSEEEILKVLFPTVSHPKGLSKPLGCETVDENRLSDRIAHKVGSFQNAYAKAFNKQQNRKGSLFMQSFGRKEVDTSAYFSKVVHYIHANAVHHGFVKHIEDWAYTSYHAYLSQKESKLNRIETVQWFGNLQDFIDFHKNNIDESLALDMEDFY